MACSGRAEILDRSTHETSSAIPSSVGAEIPETGADRQSSRPPEEGDLRGGEDESVVCPRVERPTGSYTFDASDWAGRERGESGPVTERGYQLQVAQGVPRIGGIPVGRQPVGGRLLCRDDWDTKFQSVEEIYQRRGEQYTTAQEKKPRPLGRGASFP